MKVQWCWRCNKDVPMLEEHEFAPIQTLHDELDRALAALEGGGLSGKALSRQRAALIVRRDRKMMRLYEEVTGVAAEAPYAVIHHRASLYGPACPACGKVLRTPKASRCLECGWRRDRSG